MSVQMQLRRIIISEIQDEQVIMLKEVEGDRIFPMMIGIFEASSIDRRVKHMVSPRPLTHDLIASTIEKLGVNSETSLLTKSANRPILRLFASPSMAKLSRWIADRPTP